MHDKKGKTRPEYQREYRERKKKIDNTFLSRERDRVKGYRVHINRLTKNKQNAVRKRNRVYSQVYRNKLKLTDTTTKRVFEETDRSEQSEIVSSSTTNMPTYEF